MNGSPSQPRPVVVIRPRAGWRALDLSELASRRWLLWLLAERDIRVRYKQTVLGVAWALLQPLGFAAILAFTLGRLAGLSVAEQLPYAAFVLAGLLVWSPFASCLGHVAGTLVENERLVTKVYFPRLLLPVSAALASALDAVIVAVALCAMIPWFGVSVGWLPLLALPLAAYALVVALSVGVWIAALNVFYRDFRYILPFLMQAWMLASPVAYPPGVVAAAWRPVYALNPVVGPLEVARWSLHPDATPFPTLELGISLAVVTTLLLLGTVVFRRLEHRFADAV